MEKYTKFIFYVLVIILLIFSGILYHKYSALENRISSFTQTQTVTRINTSPPDVFQKFKEDYYIKQLDRDTTLILVLFPVMLGLVAAFSFKSVKDEFKSQIEQLKQDYERQINNFEETTERFYEIEGDVNYEVASIRDKESIEYQTKQKWEDFAAYKLLAVDYYAKSINQKKSANSKFFNSVISIIKTNLELIDDAIGIKGNAMRMEELSYDKFVRIKQNIEKLNKPELSKLISTIFSKLEFDLLE